MGLCEGNETAARPGKPNPTLAGVVLTEERTHPACSPRDAFTETQRGPMPCTLPHGAVRGAFPARRRVGCRAANPACERDGSGQVVSTGLGPGSDLPRTRDRRASPGRNVAFGRDTQRNDTNDTQRHTRHVPRPVAVWCARGVSWPPWARPIAEPSATTGRFLPLSPSAEGDRLARQGRRCPGRPVRQPANPPGPGKRTTTIP